MNVWLTAIRPATLTASFAPVAVGTALAIADNAFRPLVALAALLGAVFIQIGTNLHNDYCDFKSGADTDERLGQARVTQRGWLKPNTVKFGAVVAFGIATLFGLYLMWAGGWPILVIGILSIICGLAYTGGPIPLGYVGLGDAFVLIFFGLVAVCGTYYAQTLSLTAPVVLASLPVGALATAILVVNNLRDRNTDARAGKNTLAVRFGERFARAEYTGLVLSAYLLPVVVWASGIGHIGWLLPTLTFPFALKELKALQHTDGAALNPHLGSTARLGLLYAAFLCGGLVL